MNAARIDVDFTVVSRLEDFGKGAYENSRFRARS